MKGTSSDNKNHGRYSVCSSHVTPTLGKFKMVTVYTYLRSFQATQIQSTSYLKERVCVYNCEKAIFQKFSLVERNQGVLEIVHRSYLVTEQVIKFRIWFKWLVLYWKHATGVPLKCFQKHTKVNSRMVQISLHMGVNNKTLKFH